MSISMRGQGTGVRGQGSGRCAFTILETMIALSILLIAMVLVMQVGFWSMEERRRNAARQEAVEAAANVMETARALPHEGLTPEWAARQQLPAALAPRLRDGKLTVKVEPEASRPHCKRVTVEIRWKQAEDIPARPVQLTALFAERTHTVGGKP